MRGEDHLADCLTLHVDDFGKRENSAPVVSRERGTGSSDHLVDKRDLDRPLATRAGKENFCGVARHENLRAEANFAEVLKVVVALGVAGQGALGGDRALDGELAGHDTFVGKNLEGWRKDERAPGDGLDDSAGERLASSSQDDIVHPVRIGFAGDRTEAVGREFKAACQGDGRSRNGIESGAGSNGVGKGPR